MNQNNINIDLNETLPIICNDCGHEFFTQALMIRKVSGILTGTGQPSYIPIPVFKCSKCGHVNEEFLPKESRRLNEE